MLYRLTSPEKIITYKELTFCSFYVKKDKCFVAENYKVEKRHDLQSSPLLKETLKKCFSFYKALSRPNSSCSYFCRKLKCLRDIENSIQKNLKIQTNQLIDVCPTFYPQLSKEELICDEYRTRPAFVSDFALKTTDRKFLHVEPNGNVSLKKANQLTKWRLNLLEYNSYANFTKIFSQTKSVLDLIIFGNICGSESCVHRSQIDF